MFVRLLALTTRGVTGVADGTLAFGPDLNVVLARDGEATSFRAVVSALACGRSPFGASLFGTSGTKPGNGEAPSAALDVELSDGSRIRLSCSMGRPFRAQHVPSGNDCTGDYLAGRYGFVAPLSDQERVELASTHALINDAQLQRLRGLEARARSSRWWHTIDGPQVILCGAVGIAIGAFLWPMSRVAAIAVGIIVALIVAALVTAYTNRQRKLELQAALVRLGASSTDQLERRLGDLRALQRRRADEEAWQASWAEHMRDMPELAVFEAQPLVVQTEPQIGPVFLRIDGTRVHGFLEQPGGSIANLAQSAQAFMFVPSLAQDEQRQAYSGLPSTLIALSE